jgi:hypothetical protein
MSLQLISDEVSSIKTRLDVLTTEITNLEMCINLEEDPDKASIFAEIFFQKVEEFKKLQQQFREVVTKFEQHKKSNIVNFTAKKLLKVNK